MQMGRRQVLRFGLAGTAACSATAAGMGGRDESDTRKEVRYLDAKRGRNPFTLNPPTERPHIFL